jgi:hypothetical protein
MAPAASDFRTIARAIHRVLGRPRAQGRRLFGAVVLVLIIVWVSRRIMLPIAARILRLTNQVEMFSGAVIGLNQCRAGRSRFVCRGINAGLAEPKIKARLCTPV